MPHQELSRFSYQFSITLRPMRGPTETYRSLRKLIVGLNPCWNLTMNSLSHMFKQRHLLLLQRKSRVPYQSNNLLLVFFHLKQPSNLARFSDHPRDAVEIWQTIHSTLMIKWKYRHNMKWLEKRFWEDHTSNITKPEFWQS